MELEHRINDTINNQTDEEIGNGSTNQTSAIDTVAIIPNRKKCDKADWTNPIYKSLIHTRRTSYHIHEPKDEQESKVSRMGYPDQVVEKSIDRSGMVDIVNQEQLTEEYRNIQDLSINNNVYISGEMGRNLINTRIGHTENIQTMESENPNIELKRNNCNLIRTELFLANIATQPFAIPEGKAKVGLRRLVDQILLYIEEQQQEVKFGHIPGINNTEADQLSRLAVSGDYSIDKQMLQQVLEEWGIQITVDCFATRRKTKHYRYFSIESDALAENWDGMEQSWECETQRLHCPISLIPAVIRNVELEKVKGVLIAPV
ncbi:MAG: hypothetical protein EZS28_036825 [Streblomastix strix]|uniref:Uncharacterized protein n=1 Tax=Streblomastix strix TaxID=222440 RepID=A0A5J4UAX0_9EUKA|nr:MAG: hypothetical protein EZS28_036825 [Streblomastix strix]